MKNKQIIFIVVVVLIVIALLCLFSKKSKEERLSNRRIAEIFILNIDTTIEVKINKYKELNDFFIDETAKSNFAIDRVYKKASYSHDNGYIKILTLSQQHNSCIGEMFSLSKGFISKKQVSFDSTHLRQFNSYCDDRYYHIKNDDSLSFTNYSLLEIDDFGQIFFNVREDFSGAKIENIKGHCGKTWINEYLSEMNYYLEK